MNKKMRCCFAGHDGIYSNDVKEKIKTIAENLIVNCNVNEFWVGNYGGFDRCSGTAIAELKKAYPQIELDCVIPYLTKDINAYQAFYKKKYDNILIADISLITPKKLQIIKTNEYMVNHSDFLICYIDHAWGGAFRTFDYAKRKKLQVYNIADDIIMIP